MRQANPPPDQTTLVRKLLMLGNQLLNLATEVTQQRADEAEEGGIHAALANDSAYWVLIAEELYRDRRRRAHYLPRDLLGEPGWDMLLDLYIAEKRNQSVSVTSACIAADVPHSTALRWLKQLESEGLVGRTDDACDARRHYVRLTEAGYQHMTAYFADCHSDFLSDDLLRRVPRDQHKTSPA